MDLELNLTKSVEENAAQYFESAKKAKKKLAGAQKALEESKRKLAQLQQEEQKFWQQEQARKEEQQRKAERKREWYEKFHWFISSEGFLCIGGKDATSNDIIIKKHLEKDDLVFHTEAAGSPFFLVKEGNKERGNLAGKTAGEITLQEAAQATAVYSRAWKLGVSSADVFLVKPEQVSKEAPAGEYLVKGSFMIYGRKTFYHPKLEYAIGLVEGQIIAGPETAVKKQTSNFVIVFPGNEGKGELAKKIKHQLGGGDLDDIQKFLPAGGGLVKKLNQKLNKGSAPFRLDHASVV